MAEKARARANVQAMLPHLFYRDGRFNVDAYRATKPNNFDIQPSHVAPLERMYPDSVLEGNVVARPTAPNISSEKSPFHELLPRLEDQYLKHEHAMVQLEMDLYDVRDRAKKHRQKGMEQTDAMHKGLNARDRSPTRK